MKAVNLLTLNGNFNNGNKLQHYALQCAINKFNVNIKTIYCYGIENRFNFIKNKIKNAIRFFLKRRYRNFCLFDQKIKYSNMYIKNGKIKNKRDVDYCIVGSDQVWNTTFKSFNDQYLLKDFDKCKKISYAASFGTDNLDENYYEIFKNELQKFDYISVREDRGKEIVEKLTERKDVEVLVDPTMLLTAEEWDRVSKKPRNLKYKKYILNYFLGDLSIERKNEIERIAKENDCEIINILDKNDPFFTSGPSEFLYLEKNAFLICTDSFHSSVFAILYNRPFIVFEREQKGVENMGSRIDTLLSKFEIDNRRFEGKITEENLNHDYTKAYKILEEERKKSIEFLKKALN